jgi:hypothetical protein
MKPGEILLERMVQISDARYRIQAIAHKKRTTMARLRAETVVARGAPHRVTLRSQMREGHMPINDSITNGCRGW